MLAETGGEQITRPDAPIAQREANRDSEDTRPRRETEAKTGMDGLNWRDGNRMGRIPLQNIALRSLMTCDVL